LKSLAISSRLVLLILVAATPVLVLHVWSALDTRTQVLATATDELTRSARLLAAQQVQLFLNARDVLSTLLVMADEIGADGFGCGPLLDRIAAENDSYAALAIAVVGGGVLCSSNSDAIGDYFGDQEFMERVLAEGSMVVGAPANGVLPLALTTHVASGQTQYVGLALLDLQRLTADMALSRLPTEGVGLIFDDDGNVLARAPANSTTSLEVLDALGRQATPAAAGGATLIETITVDETRELWAVTDLLPEQGLLVAIGVDIDELVAPAEGRLWRGIGILIAVFAGAGITAWIIGEQTIRRPLERLARSASALQAGDLSARYHPTSNARELRQLASAFNKMASSIEDHQEQLEQRNKRLNELIGEKEMLVREMNHRIKNSLQLVSSVVGLELDEIASPEAQSRLRDAQLRIAAIARVHERLYAGARLNVVEIKPFLEALCADLRRSSGIGDRQLSISVDECDLPPDQAIPLGMIATELVTNAIKHSGEERSKIEIDLDRTKDGITLAVSDEGPGMSGSFDPAKTAGLGLRLVQALARQLEAEFSFERLESGTRFVLRIPLATG
jgi:two-component sensor histidine kinase